MKNIIKTFNKTAVIASVLTMFATAGSAATCSFNGTDFSVTIASATECYAGNDSQLIDQNFSLFSLTGWSESDKNEDNIAGSPISFDLAPVNGDYSGNWSIVDYAGYTNVTLILKAGNQFGAFLLNTAYLSGTWASSKDLSHASIFVQGDPSPIPLPAGGVMLLTGLFGLGFARKRRNKV